MPPATPQVGLPLVFPLPLLPLETPDATRQDRVARHKIRRKGVSSLGRLSAGDESNQSQHQSSSITMAPSSPAFTKTTSSSLASIASPLPRLACSSRLSRVSSASLLRLAGYPLARCGTPFAVGVGDVLGFGGIMISSGMATGAEPSGRDLMVGEADELR
jgi:hypothetical protein